MSNFRTISNTQLKSSVELEHAQEYLEFISQIGFIDPNEARNIFNNFDPNLAETQEQSLLLRVGQCKILSIEGNLIQALQSFQELEKDVRHLNHLRPESEKNDVFAFVLYEVGVFQRKIFDNELAGRRFKEASVYCTSERLGLMIDYQLELLYVEQGIKPGITRLQGIVNRFRDLGMTMPLIFGLHRIAIYYRKKGDVKIAAGLFNDALQISRSTNSRYQEFLLLLAIAQSKLDEKKYTECTQILADIFARANSYFIKVLVKEKQAIVHYNQRQYKLAADICFEALTLSSSNQIFAQIPGQCLFLGLMYRKCLHDPIKARYYYKLGYDSAKAQVKSGLSLSGVRETAIDKYVEFLSNHLEDNLTHQPEDHLFAFADGQTWEQIKDIFNYNLLMFHRLNERHGSEYLIRLGITRPTYYSNQVKLKKKGFEFPDFRANKLKISSARLNQQLQDFISRLDDKSWFGARAQFEKDIMLYLFKKHGYQKSNLVKILGISYQAIRTKTQHITQISN